MSADGLQSGLSDSPQSLIRLRALRKTYGHGEAAFEALRGIDLDINKGEFVAIMGHSGSGKSTLMNLLGCLDTPTQGSYTYQGIAVETLDSDQRSLLRRHALGFVFQGFNLLARTSSLENVELPLLYRGISSSDRHRLALAALTAVGLPDKLRNTPAELSGGQQQRVAIARAIVTSPSTLFADEPTGNLDSATTLEIMDLLIRLNEQLGITILMVTHENEVAAYAKRIVSIRDGLIEWDRVNTQRAIPAKRMTKEGGADSGSAAAGIAGGAPSDPVPSAFSQADPTGGASSSASGSATSLPS